jgi:hypothetical protein
MSVEALWNLSMKEGRLFVLFVPMRSIELGYASDCVLALFGKLSRRRGVPAWFQGIWTWGAKVLEY